MRMFRYGLLICLLGLKTVWAQDVTVKRNIEKMKRPIEIRPDAYYLDSVRLSLGDIWGLIGESGNTSAIRYLNKSKSSRARGNILLAIGIPASIVGALAYGYISIGLSKNLSGKQSPLGAFLPVFTIIPLVTGPIIVVIGTSTKNAHDEYIFKAVNAFNAGLAKQ
jgi:hypothetical protein